MITQLLTDMIAYFSGDVRRINHALKVYAFSLIIAEGCSIDQDSRQILSAAAILHDIGIHEAEKKYNSSAGNYQEIEGPPIARSLLGRYDLAEPDVDRICHIIGHHHSYSAIDGIDFQILVEADCIVNIFEDSMGTGAVMRIREKIFRTETGIRLLDTMYLNTPDN
jgi:HD superfamily phosphodiesterase